MTIDKNGIHLDSFIDIFSNFVDGFKSIYGEDINVEQNTPDGQVIGILSNVVYDLQTQLARIYNAFDPDLAEGHELDKILKLLATTRLPATKSTVDIEINANKEVYLDENYTIKDENNQEWIITNPKTIPAGVSTLTFESKDWGRIEAPANTINKQVTILPEIDSVNNPNPAVVGRDEESDIDLRKRRNKLIGYNAKSLISGIVGKILDLENVEDCLIYENYTNFKDNDRDIDPHTMWIIVDGGEINEIAKVIATDKTIGCGLKGEITATYEEEFLRSDGTTRTHYHKVKFDRPTKTDIYIRFKTKKKSATDIIDTNLIKDKLIELHFNIAQNITATELYATIYQGGNNFIAYDLELSKDNDTWIDDILLADYSEKFVIIKDNIEITEE
jgi:uncharacterized phage protein gp47/JayE